MCTLRSGGHGDHLEVRPQWSTFCLRRLTSFPHADVFTLLPRLSGLSPRSGLSSASRGRLGQVSVQVKLLGGIS